jgi:DNA processing protein
MSGTPPGVRGAGACSGCQRRGWLLAELAGPLDRVCADRERLIEVLSLEDEPLMRALAGRRRAQLQEEYAAFTADTRRTRGRAHVVCRHDHRFPAALRFRSAPRALHLTHSPERLSELASGPVAAVLGSARASDYGMEVARALAGGLAAAGVTLACGLMDGIARAALTGALAADGRVVCVLAGGLEVAVPARRRQLYARLMRRGLAISELPSGAAARRWGQPASLRAIAGLAQLTVIVEAEDSARELAPAAIASALGRRLGAVPGRVSSPLSRGTNALLASGAHLVRGAADALELLSAGAAGAEITRRRGRAELEPRLRRVLDRVGAGCDTPERLRREGEHLGALLQALSELELMGLLARGDAGRYVSRDL